MSDRTASATTAAPAALQEAASATAKKLADNATEIAESLVVDSPEMYQLAAGELQAIVAKKKKIEDLRLSITRPMDEAKKRVMDLFRGPIAALERAQDKIEGAMLAFKRAEDHRVAAERAEAERKAREEREEAERARKLAEQEAERALQEAAAAAAQGDIATAAAAELRASQASEAAVAAEVTLELSEIAPSAPVETSRAKASGIGGRENWKAEVTDLRALVIAAGKAAEAGDDTLLGYLMADTQALGGVARALKKQARVPGVRFYAKESLSVRTAA